MLRKIVAMPLIPGRNCRDHRIRSNLSYAKYAQASWSWWCKKRGIDFIVFDQPLGGSKFSHLAPTFQRWLIPEVLLPFCDSDTKLALVDADTMIRWDAPDVFDQADGFAAVKGEAQHWILPSIQAFQALFPGTFLPLEQYFNTGLVILGNRQLPAIQAFLEFSLRHWTDLNTVMQSGNFGTDQTPLNFIFRREGVPVHLLPRAFNVLHCFPMDATLKAIERSPAPDPILFTERAFSLPEAFEFLERGYIWHFNSVVAMRSVVMRETWRRVGPNYPGVYVSENGSRRA